MTVADRIKERREELQMSQEDLALKLGLKGKSSISKIESAGDKVSLKNIEKLAPLLMCSVQYLMGWTERKEPADADSLTYIITQKINGLSDDQKQDVLAYIDFQATRSRQAAQKPTDH